MAFPQPFSGGDAGSPPDFMDLIGGPPEENNRKVILDSRSSESEKQKLSAAEIQRRKINAASEYYRKLRENSLGPPPPLVPNNEVKSSNSSTAATGTTTTHASAGNSQLQASQQQQYESQQGPNLEQLKPNIDLGAVVRSTIINTAKGVTKVFSQHWIVIGGQIKVLLLDFEGSFTLLIPNVEHGKAFRANSANVEVQRKDNGQQQLTFMKFTFSNPPMEISAPVLQDKQMGFQVLKQNSACVFLGRILDTVKTQQQQQQQQQPQTTTVSLSQLLELQQKEEESQFSHSRVQLPQGTVILPATTECSTVQQPQIVVRPQQQRFVQRLQVVPQQVIKPQQQQQVVHLQPQVIPVTPVTPQPPTVSPQKSVLTVSKPQEKSPSPSKEPEKRPVSPEGPKVLIFVEQLKESVYKGLKPKELDKIIQCRYCPKKFNFLAEHLSHLKKHTQNVESVAEMTIKMWVPDRKLKCDECKFKTSYTLDYAKHKDTHVVKGLACSICKCEVSTPQAYGEHMEIHHPSLVFNEVQDDSNPGASKPNQRDNDENVVEKSGESMEKSPSPPPVVEKIAENQEAQNDPQVAVKKSPIQPLPSMPQFQTQNNHKSVQNDINESDFNLAPPPQVAQEQSVVPVVPSMPLMSSPVVQQRSPAQLPQALHSPGVQTSPHTSSMHSSPRMMPSPMTPRTPLMSNSPQMYTNPSTPNMLLVQSPKTSPLVQHSPANLGMSRHMPMVASPQYASPQFVTPPMQNSPLMSSPQVSLGTSSISGSPFQYNSPAKVQSNSPPKEGPQKVLEELLDGSPAPEATIQAIPELDTSRRKVSIRESLDSHEDELLEDLASYSEELSNKESVMKEQKSIDESVVSLANSLIDKITDFEDQNSEPDKDQEREEQQQKSEVAPTADFEDLHLHFTDSEAEQDKEESESESESEPEVEHKCAFCGTEFVTEKSLKIHRMKCAGSVKQKAEFEELLLQKYLKKAFDDLSDFKCEFCSDEFRSDKTLKMHRLICKKKTEQNIERKVEEKEVEPQPKVIEEAPKIQKTNAKDNNAKTSTNVIIRENDPIRAFFEQEEKKKKLKKAPPPPAKTTPTLKIKMPKPPPPPMEEPEIIPEKSSILTQHFESAKTNQHIEKLHQKDKEEVPKMPLKLKISLGPKEKPVKKPKFAILPPKPPAENQPEKLPHYSKSKEEVDKEKPRIPILPPKPVIDRPKIPILPPKPVEKLKIPVLPPKPIEKLKIPILPPKPKTGIKMKNPLLPLANPQILGQFVTKKTGTPSKGQKIHHKKILGQFVTKKNGINSKGQKNHQKKILGQFVTKKNVTEDPKIPKLVIKNPLKKQIKSNGNIEEEQHLECIEAKIRPCKVNLKNLNLNVEDWTSLPSPSPQPKQEPLKETNREKLILNMKEKSKSIGVEQKQQPILKLNIKPVKNDVVEPPKVEEESARSISVEQEQQPILKLNIKPVKNDLVEPPTKVEDKPKLKIKLPPKPKRRLLHILNGLTQNLPQPIEPTLKIPKEEEIEAIIDAHDETPIAEHLNLEDALNFVANESESKQIVPQIIENILKNVIKPPKILLPITLKVNNSVEVANEEKKREKPKFKIIRVKNNKKLKRSGSGLDLNDYKGRKRKKKKKLEKLIIRNVSSYFEPPSAEKICASILNKIIYNLPCFQEKLKLKISKDKLIKPLKIKKSNLLNKKEEINHKLKRQLEIDMVGGNDLQVASESKRRAKMEARKAMEKPPTKKKPRKSEEIDPVVVESIFEQIMGDETSNSSIEEPSKPTEPIELKVSETIGKMVQEEVNKEISKIAKKQKEVWITATDPPNPKNPIIFAKKSTAPPPADIEVTTLPLTEFESNGSQKPNPESSNNIVKSTIEAITLKTNVEELAEGQGSSDVLHMIDDLFENFFEAVKEETPETIIEEILDEVIDKVVKSKEKQVVTAKKRPRDQNAFSRSGYVKKRRKIRRKSNAKATDSEDEFSDDCGDSDFGWCDISSPANFSTKIGQLEPIDFNSSPKS